MKGLDIEIESLIDVGNKINFSNNSITKSHGTYGQVSGELNAWVIRVEHLINENFGDNSPPANLLKKANLSSINGNYEDEFIKVYSIVMGALKACKSIKPTSIISSGKWNTNYQDPAPSLLHNKSFWGIMAVLIPGSFSLGILIGTSKFDIDKNKYYEAVKDLSSDTIQYRKVIKAKEKHIKIMEGNIIILSDSLKTTKQTVKDIALAYGSILEKSKQ